MLSPAARLLAITAFVALTTFNPSAEAAKRRNLRPRSAARPVTTVAASIHLQVPATASDADGTALRSALQQACLGDIQHTTGLSARDTDQLPAGTYSSISIKVSDGQVGRDAAVVLDRVTAPVTAAIRQWIRAPLVSALAGQPYSFRATATALTATPQVSIQNKPGWATFDTSSGTLYGTPLTPMSASTATS